MKNLSVILSILLAGCVGDAKEAPPGTRSLNTPFDESQIIGVWQLAVETDDEYYLAVRSSGELVEYDYEGDSIGSGDNCYSARFFDMESYGGGNFTLTSGGVNIDVVFLMADDGFILLSGSRGSYFESDLFESDLQPLCRR